MESFEGKMMVKAVLFDMFETLISHYNCPVYFGKEMAVDAGIPAEKLHRFFRISHNHQIGLYILRQQITQCRINGYYQQFPLCFF